MKKHTFEIKNLKHNEHMSEETHCFSATLYMDGKALCIVSNRGHGGCDDYDTLPNHQNSTNKLYKVIESINAELRKEKLPCSWDKNETVSNCLEIVVGNLVNEALRMKETKKFLRRICYITPDCKAGEHYQLPASVKPTGHNVAGVMASKWWKKEYIMLNNMSIEEADKYFHKS